MGLLGKRPQALLVLAAGAADRNIRHPRGECVRGETGTDKRGAAGETGIADWAWMPHIATKNAQGEAEVGAGETELRGCREELVGRKQRMRAAMSPVCACSGGGLLSAEVNSCF